MPSQTSHTPPPQHGKGDPNAGASFIAVHFPVPWARTPETSFLASPEELRARLTEAGFQITDWVDSTEAGKAWFVALAERIRAIASDPTPAAIAARRTAPRGRR